MNSSTITINECITFIKENIEFFQAAFNHSTSFRKWVFTIGDEKAVEELDDIHKKAVFTFKHLNVYEDFLYNALIYPKGDLMVGRAPAVAEFLREIIPKLKDLAKKFKHNVGTDSNEDLSYHYIANKDEIIKINSSVVLEDYIRQRKLDALREVHAKHKGLIERYKRLRELGRTHGDEFITNLFKQVTTILQTLLLNDLDDKLDFIIRMYEWFAHSKTDANFCLGAFKKLIVDKDDYDAFEMLDTEIDIRNPLLSKMLILGEKQFGTGTVEYYSGIHLLAREVRMVDDAITCALKHYNPTLFARTVLPNKILDASTLRQRHR